MSCFTPVTTHFFSSSVQDSQSFNFSEPNLAKHLVAHSCSPRQLPRHVTPLRHDGFVKQAFDWSPHSSKKHSGRASIVPPWAANSSKPALVSSATPAKGASANPTAANAAPRAFACFWIVGSLVGFKAVVAAATSSRRLAGAIIALPQAALQVLEAAALWTAALYCNQCCGRAGILQLVVVCTARSVLARSICVVRFEERPSILGNQLNPAR